MPISTPRTTNTQMRFARNGEITPAMEFVAQREPLPPLSSFAPRWPAVAS